MFTDFLEQVRSELALKCENASVELFLRDISQYKFISQKPVLLVNFRGADLSKSPHASVLEQKADLQVSFYYFVRTLENDFTDGVFGVFEHIRALERTQVLSVKAFSHKKNASVWEVKTQMERVI